MKETLETEAWGIVDPLGDLLTFAGNEENAFFTLMSDFAGLDVEPTLREAGYRPVRVRMITIGEIPEFVKPEESESQETEI